MNNPDYVWYAHVPFCRRKCAYCDFASSAPRGTQLEQYVDLVLAELDLRRDQVDGPPLAGYVGGGTPSLLPPAQLARMIRGISGALGEPTSGELSVEVNPESASPELFALLADCGVTRISVGVQSLQPQTLRLLGRSHDAQQARITLENAVKAGFKTVGADLICAVPGQEISQLINDLRACLEAGARHVSIYVLTLEPNTPLGRDQAAGRLELPTADQVEEFYAAIQGELTDWNMIRYEVSNWAVDTASCVHHKHVWRRAEIVGLGAAAVSFANRQRSTNTEDIERYASAVRGGCRPIFSVEQLSDELAVRELILLGLRNSQGIELAQLAAMGDELMGRCAGLIKGLCDEGLLVNRPGRLVPTSRGMSLADELAVRLWP
ncbi:MAG: coproporphyrinogen-III oxidase family protein [Candidatus Alcyoniella australis]|nr:coproporphyrinogen-III oxidase family protein [Candidatus Alcyoniella australis]